MHGARGGAPKGNRNAVTHGGYTAEGIKTRRMIAELTRRARELIATV
jgi:glucans biosynthesis protein